MSNFDQYQNIKNSAILLVEGDQFQYYANIDTLENDLNFSNWRSVLLTDSFIIAHENTGTLTQDFITLTEYRWYDTWEVPSLASGCYYYAILDDSDNVKYLNINPIIYRTTTEYTKLIRYRNSKNIYNFNYEDFPNFYNAFRIQLNVRQPTGKNVQIGYELIDGSFFPVRSTTGTQRQFITVMYNEFDHEAFRAAIIHNSFEVLKNNNWFIYRKGDNDYQEEWQEQFPLSDAVVLLEETASFSSNRNV